MSLQFEALKWSNLVLFSRFFIELLFNTWYISAICALPATCKKDFVNHWILYINLFFEINNSNSFLNFFFKTFGIYCSIFKCSAIFLNPRDECCLVQTSISNFSCKFRFLNFARAKIWNLEHDMIIENVTSCKCLLQGSPVRYFSSFNFTWNCNSKMKRCQYSMLRFFFITYRTITKIINTSRTGRILVRGSHRRCSIKKLFLKILPYLLENICLAVFFLINL